MGELWILGSDCRVVGWIYVMFGNGVEVESMGGRNDWLW